MTQTDRLSRLARWGLAGALVLAVTSIGYRFFVERDAPPQADDVPNGSSGGAGQGTDNIAQLEARTRERKDDAGAWQSLGWAYFDAQRYEDAVRAYRRAVTLSPGTAVLWSSLGEALVMASDHDPMPAEALNAFTKAHKLDAKDPRARYFLGVARDLSGDHAGAIKDWMALLADTPPGAPWEQDLRRTIEQVGKINKIETATQLAAIKQPAPVAPIAAQGIPGPTRDQMAAASAMTPSQQRQMAEGMVEQLEGKLKSDPGNIDRWAMLIRSRMALGQPEKAHAALADAIKANPASAERLKQQAAMLGVR